MTGLPEVKAYLVMMLETQASIETAKLNAYLRISTINPTHIGQLLIDGQEAAIKQINQIITLLN